MKDYGRRIVTDSGFDETVEQLIHAIEMEGLQTLARIDVREQFGRALGHDFRRYVLVEAWSADLAMDALRHDLDLGVFFPSTFAVYELADGETAVVAKRPLGPFADEYDWRQDAPALAGLADAETTRVARIIDRLQHRVARPTEVVAG